MSGSASPAGMFAADMMDDPASIGLFIALTVGIAVAAAFVLPFVFARLPIRLAVPGLAVIGPVLVIVGSLVGSGAITLSGNDIGYVVLVASITGLAAIIVGWRLSRPLARDLDQLCQSHKIQRFALFDQFPYTHHIECGMLLNRR